MGRIQRGKEISNDILMGSGVLCFMLLHFMYGKEGSKQPDIPALCPWPGIRSLVPCGLGRDGAFSCLLPREKPLTLKL